MSNIIKSVATVNRSQGENGVLLPIPATTDGAVIKRRTLSGGALTLVKPPPTRDSLLAELNRIRVETDEAQRELRALQHEIEERNRQILLLEERRDALESLEGLDINEQSRLILEEAEEKATQIMESALEQAGDAVDALKAQGYIDGLEQGASEAHERFSAQHEPDIRKLEALIAGLSDMRSEMLRENENDILSLIIAVAEKVIGRALDNEPKIVVDMLREVMEQNHRESHVKVTISPDLLPAEAQIRDNVLEMICQLGREIDVSVDVEAVPGAIVVETPGGITDLGLETQLGNIHEMLLEE